MTDIPPWKLRNVAVSPSKSSLVTTSRQASPAGVISQIIRWGRSTRTSSSQTAWNVVTRRRGGSTSSTSPSAAIVPSG